MTQACLSGGGVRLSGADGPTWIRGFFPRFFPVSASLRDAGCPGDAPKKISKQCGDPYRDVLPRSSELSQNGGAIPAVRRAYMIRLHRIPSIDVLQASGDESGRTKGKENADEMAAGHPGRLYGCRRLSARHYFDYIVSYNQNGLLSVVLSDYQYAGGAHGSTVQTGVHLRPGDRQGRSSSAIFWTVKSGHHRVYRRRPSGRRSTGRVAIGALYEFDFAPFKTIGPEPEFYLSNRGVVICTFSSTPTFRTPPVSRNSISLIPL